MNVANTISTARIILVIPFVVSLISNSHSARIAALVIFLIAAITDYLDGKIARMRNEVSNLGKFIDPLADKLIISSALLVFLKIEQLNIPAWAVILILSREFIINGLRTLAASKGKILAASFAGKLKTIIQLTAVIIILLMLITNSFIFYARNIIIATAIITAFSGYIYIKNNKEILIESINET
jgi:CDP-diacylglycerol--glycerol-3-phosphate 3-phosphatidyltransferase